MTLFPRSQQLFLRHSPMPDGMLQRAYQSTPLAASSAEEVMDAETVPITFIDPLGKEIEVQAAIGKNLLEIAHEHNIELEGACGGELACATCHLIFEKEVYDSLPEKLDEEDDMLDLAFELTDTSRLGCQIKVREDHSGMKVRIPDDGY
eukprot:CAMPEP_0183309590 /NCGR_PEP_ID=MMETSP0160_2-20130417/25434_1 /TAXON_ID=2839 ORGANISM="Odontella Sinensis, Strain Grunow 1884" /NCGR_SAMPLE_ID=MMETSP0160_2 /ASSEMBLY_ACC=CAM_ASM_000250 /LENGTH=148 /DNA_ID=CAMNT_0025473645 /DNA_START=161 /DNA_END=607 /DNA_ORIENTATION=-